MKSFFLNSTTTPIGKF